MLKIQILEIVKKEEERFSVLIEFQPDVNYYMEIVVSM